MDSVWRRVVVRGERSSGRLYSYALALIALAAAAGLAVLLLHTIGPKAAIAATLLVYTVLLGSAWLGYGPGILVCFLITYVLPPLLIPGRAVHTDVARLIAPLIISLLISRVGTSTRRTEALLRQWGETLEAKVEERTKALEASEQRYRLLFDGNPVPMWVYDQATLEFLTVNGTAIERYGYSREEFLRMTLKDIRPQEDVEKLLKATAAAPAGLQQEWPWRHRKKDGQIISVEITEHPLVFEGRAASLVMAIDITERLRLGEQYRQAQRLESIGRLAGGVAHDFNNLLTVINGYASMLLDGSPGEAKLSQGLKEIQRAGERAAGLTAQLVAFSRQQVIQLAVIDVNATVRTTEAFLRRLIGEDVDLITRLTADLGLVQADAGQLQQIIMNLAVNSRDAMPHGGALTIETSNVVLDEAYRSKHYEVEPGPYVMLAVTDTGEGMTPEVQARIFEPFFTTKEIGKGTGLGLATVYGMVKHCGGWIWVYSEPKRGTTFKIYFPQTNKALSPASAHDVKTGPRGNETIVIVEDQADVRGIAIIGLTRFGYTVHGFSTGRDALEFCRTFGGEIDAVLTDVVMPDMNGREVARQVSQLRPLASILFMSGYTTNVVVRQGVLDPNVEYIQKPFTPDALARRIRDVLDSRAGSAAGGSQN